MIGSLITLPARLYLRGARTALHLAEDVTGRAVMTSVRVATTLGGLRPGGGSASTATSTPTRRREGGEDAQARRPREADARHDRSNGRPADAPQDGAERDRRATGEEIPRDPRAAAATVELEPPATRSPDEAAGELASERLEREGRVAPIDLDAPHPSPPEHVSEEAVLVEETAEPGAEDGAGAQVNIAEPWKGYARLGAREVVARLESASAAELAAVQLYETAGRNRSTVVAAAARKLRSASR